MAGWDWKKEVTSFTAMAVAESATVGINTLYKAATSKGLSYFVFIAYTYVIGTLSLVPLPFFLPRKEVPPFQLSVFYRIVVVALIGLSSNVCGYKGVEYSSPTLASAISNLTPAFTFILAALFRMENLNLRSSTTRIKIIGTILSISGALVAVFYKGPIILSPASSSPSPSPSLLLLKTPPTNWLIGGLLLVSQYLLISLWYITQAQVLKMYPDEPTVTLIYFTSKMVIALPICFIAEPKLSDWALRPDMALITIVVSGLFGPSFNTFLSTWVVHLKGPLYASIFKPFSIAIAAAFSVIFLGDALFLGSVIGATILLFGFYAVLWGQAREEEENTNGCGLYSSHEAKTSLLQSHSVEEDTENRT